MLLPHGTVQKQAFDFVQMGTIVGERMIVDNLMLIQSQIICISPMSCYQGSVLPDDIIIPIAPSHENYDVRVSDISDAMIVRGPDRPLVPPPLTILNFTF